MADQDLDLQQLFVGPMGNCVYILGDPQTRQAVIFDPAFDPIGVLGAARGEGYEVVAIIATHDHPDHVGGDIFGQHIPGLKELRKAVELPVYIHEIEAEHMMEMTGTPEQLVRRMKDGDTIELGSISIEVLHTPGHSAGSCGLLFQDHLIAGDTLFVQAIGRVDLPTSNPDDMFHSLQRLKKLPPQTRVFPGHNYGPAPDSTIGQELERNPYLRVETLEQWRVFMGMM